MESRPFVDSRYFCYLYNRQNGFIYNCISFKHFITNNTPNVFHVNRMMNYNVYIL